MAVPQSINLCFLKKQKYFHAAPARIYIYTSRLAAERASAGVFAAVFTGFWGD
jgi:hypothetical protein